MSIMHFLMWAPYVTIFYLALVLFTGMDFNSLWLILAVGFDVMGYIFQ